MKLIGKYTNGNYRVLIFDDGTKIRETIDPNDNEFIADFPESFDFKISDYCDQSCPACHENSSIFGKHGNIRKAIETFIPTLHPYTECAIGGGNPLAHPDLYMLLHALKERKVIANMTVNQNHFMKNYEEIMKMLSDGLIMGLGVSYVTYDPVFIERLSNIPNAVLHVINGVVSKKGLEQLENKRLKVLILGYKHVRRGISNYWDHGYGIITRQDELYAYLPKMTKKFAVVSFDNLAIRQLEVERLMTKEEWDTFYMGDDGTATFYVDLPNWEFSKSSTTKERYGIMNSVEYMFDTVRSMK